MYGHRRLASVSWQFDDKRSGCSRNKIRAAMETVSGSASYDGAFSREHATMGTDNRDPFEQGKLAKINRPREHEQGPRNPYPEGSEQHQRWEAGYKFVQQGLAAV
ncbi:hypothetical protein [Bradyrhizobium sp. 2TAF24]|uniref:hypothetical protein n=1 Tax=Bradyrhizobium sp. 2TAF24 TaxID=3233011 RepID=UPI003F8DAC67